VRHRPDRAGPSRHTVVATWAALLALGWALVFLPQLPDGFTFDHGLVPAEHSGFVDALYVSLVNLASLGYGDISPARPSCACSARSRRCSDSAS
jgi:Ion channel